MIEHIADKKTIGTIDIFDFDPFHNRAGVGILIANESIQRKGYASMSLICIVDYCFQTLHSTALLPPPPQLESLELFRKVGFVQAGIRKDWIKTNEGYTDEYFFQLINS